MGDDFSRLLIRQATQTGVGFVSGRFRDRKFKAEPLPEIDRPALKAAEELIARGGPPLPPAEGGGAEGALELEDGIQPAIMADESLFDQVELRGNVKAVLLAALRSKEPVHVLLEGDPACGKSELLSCIARLPNSRYAVGGATTSSGLTGYLLEKPSTTILIIDELEKADQSDLYQLYSLMQSGMVTRLQHQRTEQVHRKVWVFAAANRTDQLPAALLSRFVKIRVPNYTRGELIQVLESILTKREGLSPARAKEIAAAVAARSADPRDGVQVARLAGESGPIGPVLDQVAPRSGKKRAQTP